MNNKLVKIIFITCVGFFTLIIVFFQLSNADKTLKREHEINFFVNKVKSYKGVLLLNDSIVISKNCPKIQSDEQYNNVKSIIGDIKKPFQIIKEANNDTIKIVKDGYTMYFELIEF